ncbi:unnamed protein product [Rhizophagus irregularis]|nr:unnamed protein product [Rhizophagus irregularis]
MNSLSTFQLDHLISAFKQKQIVFRRSTASDLNNLSKIQKDVFLALQGIENFIVTGPSTMTFKESQQVYAEILFISQYLGIRRVMETNIIGFSDRCKSLNLEFMLKDFMDVGLLEFLYSQFSTTSRCLLSKLIRWKICNSMIGKEVNLCKIINSIRELIGSFLPLESSLWPEVICIISDNQQKLLDITTSPGVYSEYSRFFNIQRIIKAPQIYVDREFSYFPFRNEQNLTDQTMFHQFSVSAKKINCVAISLKRSLINTQNFHSEVNIDNSNYISYHYLRIADSVDFTDNFQNITDWQSILIIAKIKPCKRCKHVYDFNYEKISDETKQMTDYYIMCNCAESEGSIHLVAPQIKSKFQKYTDLIIDLFENREYLIFIGINLFTNFFRRLRD